jgi:hypothetical protein
MYATIPSIHQTLLLNEPHGSDMLAVTVHPLQDIPACGQNLADPSCHLEPVFETCES